MTHKNQALKKFKAYKALVETQLDMKIKCIQSDNKRIRQNLTNI